MMITFTDKETGCKIVADDSNLKELAKIGSCLLADAMANFYLDGKSTTIEVKFEDEEE